MVVAACVEQPPLATPPSSPALGACFIVAPDASGEWTGKGHCLAAWTSGGWRFVQPVDGMTALVRSDGLSATFRAGTWTMGRVAGSRLEIDGLQVVGSRTGAIADPSGGTTVDASARAALAQVLAALRQHGLIAT